MRCSLRRRGWGGNGRLSITALMAVWTWGNVTSGFFPPQPLRLAGQEQVADLCDQLMSLERGITADLEVHRGKGRGKGVSVRNQIQPLSLGIIVKRFLTPFPTTPFPDPAYYFVTSLATCWPLMKRRTRCSPLSGVAVIVSNQRGGKTQSFQIISSETPLRDWPLCVKTMRAFELFTGSKRAAFHWLPSGCSGVFFTLLTSRHSVPVQCWMT